MSEPVRIYRTAFEHDGVLVAIAVDPPPPHTDPGMMIVVPVGAWLHAQDAVAFLAAIRERQAELTQNLLNVS